MNGIVLQTTGINGTSLGGVLGSLGGNIGAQLSVGLPIVAIVIVVFVIYLFYARRKAAKKGGSTSIGALQGNTALIYSLHHNAIIDVKPFRIRRITDPNGNIERTVAVFADSDQSKKKGFIEQLKGFLGRGSAPKTDINEIGWAFSESLASTYKNQAWIACFTLESNMQIPLTMMDKNLYSPSSQPQQSTELSDGAEWQIPFVTNDPKIISQLEEIERNTERRISRIKAAVSAADNYVQNAQPVESAAKLMLVGTILLFVALIAIAIVLNSLNGSIGNLLHLATTAAT